MSIFRNLSNSTRFSIYLERAFWIIAGSMAMLWWLPGYIGEKSGIRWQQGAICYLALLFLTFNRITVVGMENFFKSSKAFLKPRLLLLFIFSLGFVFGFFVQA